MALVDSDPLGPLGPPPTVVATSRGTLEYADFGEGACVLSLHGAMGGHDQSALLARTIGEEGYRVIAVSRPGYLGSGLASARTPAEQADLYAEALQTLRIERVAVMAVSGGGPSAIEFALRHRDVCSCLVLVSTVSGKMQTSLPFSFYLMKFLTRFPWFERSVKGRASRAHEKAAERAILDPVVRARTLDDPEAGPLFEALTTSTTQRLAERMLGTENDIKVTRTTEYALENVAVPVLVIHGTADRVVPFEHGRELATRIPGAKLLMVDGGEHVAIFTHRELVRPRVTGFLREHASAGLRRATTGA